MSLHVPTALEVVETLDYTLNTYQIEQRSGIVIDDWYLGDDNDLVLEAERDGTLFEIRISVSVDPR